MDCSIFNEGFESSLNPVFFSFFLLFNAFWVCHPSHEIGVDQTKVGSVSWATAASAERQNGMYVDFQPLEWNACGSSVLRMEYMWTFTGAAVLFLAETESD